jgi:hypothetical protein
MESGRCRTCLPGPRVRETITAKVLPVVDSGVKRMHLYRLRHTRITNDLPSGMLATDAAVLRGDSVKMIESVYLHAQADHLLDVVDRIRGGRRAVTSRSTPTSAAED